MTSVMVRVLAVGVIDRGFEPLSIQTKDYQISTCCFSSRHTTSMSKNKDWLVWYRGNVSEGGHARGICFRVYSV
jgi:hypothetical protein